MEILKELYYGNIQPSERSMKNGGYYQRLEKEVCSLEAAFRSELSEEGKQVYDVFQQRQCELREIADCDSFIKGYRLGVKLLLAVLLDYDTPLPQVGEG